MSRRPPMSATASGKVVAVSIELAACSQIARHSVSSCGRYARDRISRQPTCCGDAESSARSGGLPRVSSDMRKMCGKGRGARAVERKVSRLRQALRSLTHRGSRTCPCAGGSRSAVRAPDTGLRAPRSQSPAGTRNFGRWSNRFGRGPYAFRDHRPAHNAVCPPSMNRHVPVMYDASSDARNAIPFAISRAVPGRFNIVSAPKFST